MQEFKQQVSRILPVLRIVTDPLLRYAYGTDASMYRLTPQMVLIVETNTEIERIMHFANQYNIKLTFRAAGTSLSGQAVTNHVLVMLANYTWQEYKIHNNGEQITLAPGIIGANANLFLKPFKRKIGPDPASINHCKIGGIVANNSSGMCCGVSQNSYHTLKYIKLILANGSILDSSNEKSKNDFITQNSAIITGIMQIREQIQQDPDLLKLITHKFGIKNTMAYSLNAFIDFGDPIDILAHLMVGSEGTLGFISSITYNTVVDNPYKAATLVYCTNIHELINLSLNIPSKQVDAVELLDITALKSIVNLAISQKYLPTLGEDTSAMLIEVSAKNHDELTHKTHIVQQVIDKHKPYQQIHFTQDNTTYQDLWNIRKGILPTIGANRKPGTSVVIEDVAVMPEKLPELISQLRTLFAKYQYTDYAIIGHILAGNIHFIFTPCFDDVIEVERYSAFMHEVVDLVGITLQGSLKAEHGCGRNMAPFVEKEWGSKAYQIMWQIKNLLDPNGILNPDVMLTHNPDLHKQNLKSLEITDPLIDKCIECGFCESVCPSRNLTLTPRQRISSYRYLNTLKNANKQLYTKFKKVYKYFGIDSCAITSLCRTQCPVGIDTGKFILKLRNKPDTIINKFFANNFSWFVRLNKVALRLADRLSSLIGKNNSYTLSTKLHKTFKIMPVYLPTTPKVQNALFVTIEGEKQITYIPSCNNRMMADTSPQDSSSNALQKLMHTLGYTINYPTKLNELCCGQVFQSQGQPALAQQKLEEVINTINTSATTVVIDNSSCYKHIMNDNNSLNVLDSIDFIYAHLDQLNLHPHYNKIALHIDCSSKTINKQDKIQAILSHCGKQIVTPVNVSCCGFAGAKGFTMPELNQSALLGLAAQIKDCDIGVTFNRNCQIGLSHHGKKEYLSLAELVLKCLHPTT